MKTDMQFQIMDKMLCCPPPENNEMAYFLIQMLPYQAV